MNLKYAIGKLMQNSINYFDVELRDIRKIIYVYQEKLVSGSEELNTSDQIFISRLANNPNALKMYFWENHFELKSLEAYPEITGRVLDFGCGSGHLDILLARSGKSVHGIDLSPVGIRIAQYLRNKENRVVQSRVTFEVADVTRSRPNELYDSAWSAHVFEHIEDPGPAFHGLRHWLKPGAPILISVPWGDAYNDPSHVNHYYNVSQLRSYLVNHIRIIKIDSSEEHQVIRALCRFP
jgi:2-polyprenyl-3-methyl-5-hydroxy-6-metoxy-1,4-benzoquinol methylase